MKTLNLAEQRERMAELRQWEAAHPELSAKWDAAIAEDMQRRLSAADAVRNEREHEARRQRVLETAPESLVRLGAPQRAVKAWQDGIQTTPAVLAVRRMVAEGKSFCLLAGGIGSGKTVAGVVAMADRLLELKDEEVPALFVRAAEGARMGLYGEGNQRLMEQMLTAGMLVVDDLGVDALSEGNVWRSILDEVLDVRYGAMLPTVLTSNLDATMFRTRYGERIADRIRHSGILQACLGKSMRTPGEG